MKIAYFYGPEDVRIEETAIPEPGYGEVVIKNKVALTCGTDLKTYLRGHPLWIPPAVFGHEASGVVYKVGEGVEKFKVGDRVVAHNSAPCHECIYCKTHQYSMCENNLFNSGIRKFNIDKTFSFIILSFRIPFFKSLDKITLADSEFMFDKSDNAFEYFATLCTAKLLKVTS